MVVSLRILSDPHTMYVDDPLETHIISMIAATENLHRHLQFRVSGSEGVKTGFVPGLQEFYRG